MKINWNALLDGPGSIQNEIEAWSVGEVTTRRIEHILSYTPLAGEFRKLVRTHGTMYARRLARKALRYRGVNV